MPLDEDDQEKMFHAIFGNGKPGLIRDVQALQAETLTVKRALYHNPDTGEPGLIATTRTTLDLLQKMDRKLEVRDAERATEAKSNARFAKWGAWIVALVGLGGLGAFVRSVLLGG